MNDNTLQKSGSQYKDTLFRTLFGESNYFLELYNAVADEHFPDDTVVTTFPSNELLAKFNDLAACIGDQLVIFFEHQSTISNNMPLRLLSYATDILYLYFVDRDKLYRSAQVKIPTPKFYVLYNGKQKLAAHELKLSDAFIVIENEPALELTAKVIDINYSSGDDVLGRSSKLREYSILIDTIRTNLQSGMTRDKAIATAIDFCIKQNVLKEFLSEHYTEVAKMLNWEYDADAERRVLREEALQEGAEQEREKWQGVVESIVAEKDTELAEKDAENSVLRSQLIELQAKLNKQGIVD